jgi:FtsP/CotA-like multicopper oxidase with cupredoxin domain
MVNRDLVRGGGSYPILLRRGRVERFRSIHINIATEVMTLSIEEGGGCEWGLLQHDGIFVEDAPRMGVTSFVLSSGNRADFYVKCSSSSSISVSSASASFTLLLLVEEESSPVLSLPTSPFQKERPCYAVDTSSTPCYPWEGCRSLTSRFVMQDWRYFLNVPPDPAITATGDMRVDFPSGEEVSSVQMGSLLRIGIQTAGHPYHQHVKPWVITGMVTEDTTGFYKVGDAGDTIQSYKISEISISLDSIPAENSTILFHCHMYSHSDFHMYKILSLSGEANLPPSKMVRQSSPTCF